MARIQTTGSNRGIGAAHLRSAQSTGHDLGGATRNRRNGRVALNRDQPGTIVEHLSHIGPLDTLINNAGVIAPLAMAQATSPQLRPRAVPKIRPMSSQLSGMGCRKADRIAHPTSNAALMQGPTTDLAPTSIPVDPAWVPTDMEGLEAEEAPDEGRAS